MMGGVCSRCGTFRIDSRKKCAVCGGSWENRPAAGILFLRCLWCCHIFAWAPRSWADMERYPKCCTKRCKQIACLTEVCEEGNLRGKRAASNWEEREPPAAGKGEGCNGNWESVHPTRLRQQGRRPRWFLCSASPSCVSRGRWSGWPESDRRHRTWKDRVLPTELHPLIRLLPQREPQHS